MCFSNYFKILKTCFYNSQLHVERKHKTVDDTVEPKHNTADNKKTRHTQKALGYFHREQMPVTYDGKRIMLSFLWGL